MNRDERFGRDEQNGRGGYGMERRWGGEERGRMFGDRERDEDRYGRFGGERGYGRERRYGRERGWGERWGEREEGPSWSDRLRERWEDWRERRHARGPKGYQRSDERIREDIAERIADREWVDASDVEIQCKSGEVTLTGTVPARRHKRMLEDIADSVFGVRDVHNQIRVAPQTTVTPTGTKTTPRA
jgi:hypothetical protein